MRAALGLVGLLIVLGVGYAVYTSQIQHVSNEKPLKQQIDLTGVQSDLLSLAQAERLYMAANGAYASLEQLRRSGVMNAIPAASRAGYGYSVEVDGAAHFRITARPADPSQEDMPVFSIDETMQISRE
jgi:hypothetical protein